MAAEQNDPFVTEMTLLEQQVEALLARCEQLSGENKALRLRHDQVVQDRAQILRVQEQARGRVEAMINQLRSMEQR